MNKFLCSLVFVLSFSSVHAQSNDSQKEIQTLVQRVDSLEHELSYLKLTYELNTLNSDIIQSPNQKIPDRKTKCVIKTHINIKQNVIFGAKLKPV